MNQLDKMTSSDSRFLKGVRGRAKTAAGRGGLAGSSFAVAASEGKAIEAATPFALQDAQTHSRVASENMGAQNQRDIAGMQRDASIYTQGRDITSREKISDLDRASREGLAREGFEVDREGISSRERISDADRESREGISAADRSSREDLTREGFENQLMVSREGNEARMAVANIGASATVGSARIRAEAAAQEGANQREFMAAQNDFEREFRRELTEMGFAENEIDRAWREEQSDLERGWRSDEAEAGREFTGSENQLDRESREREAESNRDWQEEQGQINRDWNDAGRREQSYHSSIDNINSNPNLSEEQRRAAINDVNRRFGYQGGANDNYGGGTVPNWP